MPRSVACVIPGCDRSPQSVDHLDPWSPVPSSPSRPPTVTVCQQTSSGSSLLVIHTGRPARAAWIPVPEGSTTEPGKRFPRRGRLTRVRSLRDRYRDAVSVPAQHQDHRRGRRTSWLVSRILYPGGTGVAAIHLGLPSPAGSSGLPAGIGRAALERLRRRPTDVLLTLLRVGFTEPSRSPEMLVVSYTTVSPLPRHASAGRSGPGRSVFCGTVPRVTPGCR